MTVLVFLGVWRVPSSAPETDSAPQSTGVNSVGESKRNDTEFLGKSKPDHTLEELAEVHGEQSAAPVDSEVLDPSVVFALPRQVAYEYARQFYERPWGNTWSAVSSMLATVSTKEWSVFLTNSPDLQRTGLDSDRVIVVATRILSEKAEPQEPTIWSAMLDLEFNVDGNRVHRLAEVSVRVDNGSWRVERWEEVAQ